jgi:hypothetical protein
LISPAECEAFDAVASRSKPERDASGMSRKRFLIFRKLSQSDDVY